MLMLLGFKRHEINGIAYWYRSCPRNLSPKGPSERLGIVVLYSQGGGRGVGRLAHGNLTENYPADILWTDANTQPIHRRRNSHVHDRAEPAPGLLPRHLPRAQHVPHARAHPLQEPQGRPGASASAPRTENNPLSDARVYVRTYIHDSVLTPYTHRWRSRTSPCASTSRRSGSGTWSRRWRSSRSATACRTSRWLATPSGPSPRRGSPSTCATR